MQKSDFQNLGFEVWSDYLNPKKADSIRKKLDHFFDNNIHLGPAVNVANLNDNEIYIRGAQRKESQKKNDNFFIKKEELNKGVNHYRNLTNGRSLTDPIYRIEELLEIATDKKILEFVRKELKEENIYIGYIKLRRFFNNKISDFDTNFFHSDDNGEKILKCILYLNDVSNEEDGPFVYVEGSHKKKNCIETKYTHKEMQNIYPGKIRPLFGNKGTIIFADTLGFHRGIKPKNNDRYVLYINYVCKEEYEGKGEKQKISKRILGNNQEKLKLFQFFNKVD